MYTIISGIRRPQPTRTVKRDRTRLNKLTRTCSSSAPHCDRVAGGGKLLDATVAGIGHEHMADSAITVTMVPWRVCLIATVSEEEKI